MNWKLTFTLLIILEGIFSLIIQCLKIKSVKNPIPANVAGLYDKETHRHWQRYARERYGLKLISSCVSTVLSVVLMVTNAYAAVASLFSANVYVQLVVVLLTSQLLGLLVDLIFDYYSDLVIEEKYGFNKMTFGRFLKQKLSEFVLLTVVTILLIFAFAVPHQLWGNWGMVAYIAVYVGLAMLFSFLSPVIFRMQRKLTPLEDGELKDQLMTMLQQHNFEVRGIYVYNESAYSTRANAMFGGFGKSKTIMLADHLVNQYSTEEICAIFAHEMGHGIHKDTLKGGIVRMLHMLISCALLLPVTNCFAMHTAFGFTGLNYAFAFILSGILQSVVMPLVSLLQNAHGRRAEFRADRQAVKEGYGPALISGLKKLSSDGFANLAPHRVVVALEQVHPTLSQRIAAIEKEMETIS